jgi:hypothetical protein
MRFFIKLLNEIRLKVSTTPDAGRHRLVNRSCRGVESSEAAQPKTRLMLHVDSTNMSLSAFMFSNQKVSPRAAPKIEPALMSNLKNSLAKHEAKQQTRRHRKTIFYFSALSLLPSRRINLQPQRLA